MKKQMTDASLTTVLRGGVAKRDITNRDGSLRINDPLYVKALVLDDGHTTFAIVTMDTTAIGGRTISAGYLDDVADDFMPRLRHQVHKNLGIPAANIMVTASHTHPPNLVAELSCTKKIHMLCDDESQLERAYNAIAEAKKNMVPVKIGTGIEHEDRLTINRNIRLKNGRDWPMRMWESCPLDENIESLGPIDPEIGLIKVDRMDGSTLAVAYNFASHLSMGVPEGGISADFPGFASKIIEENLGGEVMAFFLQGAAGDIGELITKDYRHLWGAEEVGNALGLSVLRGIRKIKCKDASLKTISEVIELPRRTDIPKLIKALEEEQAELLESLIYNVLNFKSFLPLYIKHNISPEYPEHQAYRYMQEAAIGKSALSNMDIEEKKYIDKYLKNIYAMEKLSSIRDKVFTLKKHKKINDDSGEKTIQTEVQGIKIGDCVIITSPAELLAEVGLNLKKYSSHKYTFVVPYSNGYMHYGAPEEYYDRGGYEVTECLLDSKWQNIYEEKAKIIMNSLV
jgi:hypothetical protein